MKRKLTFSVIFFLSLCINILSQNQEKKWTLTFGSASVLYSTENSSAVGARYLAQFPRFSIGRYMFKNTTFVGSISSSYGGFQKYTTFDGEARYDFGTSENRISPYILIGGSFIEAAKLTPTLNFGAGGTLWISERFGLNGQLVYKISENRFTSERSHTFGSVGLVYRFSFSKSSASGFSTNRTTVRNSRRKRLWNTKN